MRYEHILEDSETVRRRLYAALGLSAADGRLALGEIHRAVIRPDEGWKDDHQGAVADTRRVKFERIFDAGQKKLIGDLVETPPPRLLEQCI